MISGCIFYEWVKCLVLAYKSSRPGTIFSTYNKTTILSPAGNQWYARCTKYIATINRERVSQTLKEEEKTGQAVVNTSIKRIL